MGHAPLNPHIDFEPKKHLRTNILNTLVLPNLLCPFSFLYPPWAILSYLEICILRWSFYRLIPPFIFYRAGNLRGQHAACSRWQWSLQACPRSRILSCKMYICADYRALSGDTGVGTRADHQNRLATTLYNTANSIQSLWTAQYVFVLHTATLSPPHYYTCRQQTMAIHRVLRATKS
jgi:hypothetical protein